MIEEIEKRGSCVGGSFLSLKFDDSEYESSSQLNRKSSDWSGYEQNSSSSSAERSHSQNKSPKETYFIREPNGQQTEFVEDTPKYLKSPEKRLVIEKDTLKNASRLQLIKEEPHTTKLKSNPINTSTKSRALVSRKGNKSIKCKRPKGAIPDSDFTDMVY